jgi:glycosyltransferase involved in cell wall biosynthesis
MQKNQRIDRMRIAYIAAGAAGSYCGACNRDVTLSRRLRAMGHDVFVMPSFKETFGVVYLEALSQGLPILHSIGQGVDGFFDDSRVSEAVDPGSIADIARGIRELAQRRDDVRNSCIDQVRPFSWDRIASRYDQLYRSTGDCAPPPPNH